jgi:hypothetical protein
MSPGGKPCHLVGLGDAGTAVDRLEAVAPDDALAAPFLGGEGELGG